MTGEGRQLVISTAAGIIMSVLGSRQKSKNALYP
jgi:hypothetical protein